MEDEELTLTFEPVEGGFECVVETLGTIMDQGLISDSGMLGCDFVVPKPFVDCRIGEVLNAAGHGFQKETNQTRFRVIPDDINQSASAQFFCR